MKALRSAFAALLASRKGLAFLFTSTVLVVVALASGRLGIAEGVFESLATALVFSQAAFSGSNAVAHWAPKGSVAAGGKAPEAEQ